jgi:hypothetical protein
MHCRRLAALVLLLASACNKPQPSDPRLKGPGVVYEDAPVVKPKYVMTQWGRISTEDADALQRARAAANNPKNPPGVQLVPLGSAETDSGSQAAPPASVLSKSGVFNK